MAVADVTLVKPKQEQPRVQDEQERVGQYVAEFWDAITSERLPTDLTSAARQEEFGFMNDWKVWDVAPWNYNILMIF